MIPLTASTTTNVSLYRAPPRARFAQMSSLQSTSFEKQYKGAKVERNVREEGWFPRYFAQNETALMNAFRRNSNVKIRMVGIQGCLTFGTATRYEWTALTEDINSTVKSGAIKVRHGNATSPQVLR